MAGAVDGRDDSQEHLRGFIQPVQRAWRPECEQADESRKQSQNLNACFDKLTSMIAEAGRVAVPGETSPEQKKKVQKLYVIDTEKTTKVIKKTTANGYYRQRAANEARIRMKKEHSNKKSSRKGRSDE
ncbi:peptidyl-tRNA hydrolase domain protein [Trichophyton verrucosum HKI 0517]|uniref:Peptidyl-tRNA hydrolase domain protein n=1 Tax=Trichophyton verrucosum (strain HKI 0517) TaxID=663202 RepID=D4D867_TRIVH|nr:peptidyl-tRNA hydrolase domain protein [Trichophyton verrucosum HKI 0517]EFE41946.1 peptidyl-tRNA hydrolase domain protein [Trichophyton verrucosum HKI 0517]